MIRSGDTTNCRFCGKSFVAGRKGEDVSSSWYAKAIGFPDGYVTITVADYRGDFVEETRKTQTPAAEEFRLRDVCPDDCNGAWMSTIESSAKPLLLQLMRGDQLQLTAADRETIATWAQLKAICWDALQVDPALPNSVYSQFRTARPLHWAVTINRVESHGPSDITFGRHVGLFSVAGAEDSAPLVFRATIIFDELMMTVTTVLDATQPPPELFRQMVPNGYLGIWPPMPHDKAVLSWPHPTTLTKAEILM